MFSSTPVVKTFTMTLQSRYSFKGILCIDLSWSSQNWYVQHWKNTLIFLRKYRPGLFASLIFPQCSVIRHVGLLDFFNIATFFTWAKYRKHLDTLRKTFLNFSQSRETFQFLDFYAVQRKSIWALITSKTLVHWSEGKFEWDNSNK